MQITFVHPFTKEKLIETPDGLVRKEGNALRLICESQDGSYDFAQLTPEAAEAREAYDQFYSKAPRKPLEIRDFSAQWNDPTVPWRRTLFTSLGELAGRRILLLGNGASYKEFLFAHLGAELVFTDLSLVAVQAAKEAFRNCKQLCHVRDAVAFHAVDATHLPFASESFDIIYGSKFVGFLQDIRAFFQEVHRCLRPGGICRFTDDAFSPVWEGFRKRVVLPCKALLSRRSAISKVRSASRFGFEESAIRNLARQCGFTQTFYTREFFLLRAVQLFYGKTVRWNPSWLAVARPVFLCAKQVDRVFAGTDWMRKNALGLTWGFGK